MNTPLVQAIIAKGGEEYTRYWKDGSPMGKLGQPEDLRGLVPKTPSLASRVPWSFWLRAWEILTDRSDCVYGE